MVKLSKLLRITVAFCLILAIQLVAEVSCRADQSGLILIEQYGAEAYRTLEKMIEAKSGGLRTIVLPFNGYKEPGSAVLLEYENWGNSDERFFADCLFEQLVISKKFKVFTRDKLEKALKELKLQMTDLFDPETAKRVGKFIGADLLFLMEGYIGRAGFSYSYGFCAIGGVFRVKVLVIDVETAEVKGIWKKFIIKGD